MALIYGADYFYHHRFISVLHNAFFFHRITSFANKYVYITNTTLITW
jgi:hypothetical protein